MSFLHFALWKKTKCKGDLACFDPKEHSWLWCDPSKEEKYNFGGRKRKGKLSRKWEISQNEGYGYWGNGSRGEWSSGQLCLFQTQWLYFFLVDFGLVGLFACVSAWDKLPSQPSHSPWICCLTQIQLRVAAKRRGNISHPSGPHHKQRGALLCQLLAWAGPSGELESLCQGEGSHWSRCWATEKNYWFQSLRFLRAAAHPLPLVGGRR